MRPSELWPEMEAGEKPVMRAALHLGTEASFLCLRGGRSGQGELALRLPVETDTFRLLVEWEGLDITRLASDNMPGQQLIRIAPIDEAYRDLYIHLADDIHDHLEEVTIPSEAVRATVLRLRLWSGFLRRNTRQLDGRAVRGLFAELSALEQFLVPALGWERALGAWMGPTGTPQDVMTDHVVLDIKATQAGDSLITVSSIEQLDPLGSRTVYLLQAILIEGAGEDLHGLIDRLRLSAATVGAGAMLGARLIQAGVTNAVLDSMDEQLMAVTSWRLHNADDPGFPRLKRADLHPGIVSANYRIDLARMTGGITELNKLTSLLKEPQPGKTK